MSTPYFADGGRKLRGSRKNADTGSQIVTQGVGALLPLRRAKATQFARPADTTAYAIGDVISTLAGAVITFADIVDVAGDYVWVEAVKLFMSTAVATALAAELNLFAVAPAVIADNAAWAPTDAEMLNWVAGIPLTNSFAGTVNRNYITSALAMPCKTVDKNLYGVLVARNAYVPTSAETFDLTLHVRDAV